ncbi:hypothetical protein APASM_3741 [Actinosynnema pretiosum subsp. pretiosum]|nr:hypothetical protein APASM_3741 [Actinosynnema pretiosum subsp. pretiosum]
MTAGRAEEVILQPFPFAPWIWRDAITALHEQEHPLEPDVSLADRPDTGLLGFEVRATDGRVGVVDSENALLPADCLVVDVSGGNRVALPVGVVSGVDREARVVQVDRTTEQVAGAPEFDPDEVDPPAYRERLGEYYSDSYRVTPPW